jgi:hypothetical protein
LFKEERWIAGCRDQWPGGFTVYFQPIIQYSFTPSIHGGAVHVFIQVKPECVERFIETTKENAGNSLKEAGIARFDLIQ